MPNQRQSIHAFCVFCGGFPGGIGFVGVACKGVGTGFGGGNAGYAEPAGAAQSEGILTVFADIRQAMGDAPLTYIVDAIDLVSCKLDLAETARRLGVPLIMALGTGNKLDPSLLRLADISETYGCPLARVMRKELRNRGILHQTVVFSPEQPAPTQQLEAPPPGRRSVPASNPWVPATAGLLMGSKVVRDLIAQKEA